MRRPWHTGAVAPKGEEVVVELVLVVVVVVVL
jgi:hypothetical protein